MNLNQSQSTSRLITGAVVALILIVAIPAAILLLVRSGDEKSGSTTKPTPAALQEPSTATQPNVASSTATSPSTYKDGLYTKKIGYEVPEGDTNSIEVKIEIMDSIVKSVSIISEYDGRESKKYISNFEGAISGAINGKKINELPKSRLAGASLTTSAFNQAIDQVLLSAKN
jgi:uncharacterized protein with FMN-binding domain